MHKRLVKDRIVDMDSLHLIQPKPFDHFLQNLPALV